MTPPSEVTGSFYLVLKRKRGWRHHLGPLRAFANKPSLKPGEIAIRLKVVVPESVFAEFIPSGTLTLPEDVRVGRAEIEVEIPEGLPTGVRMTLAPVESQGDQP